MGMVRGTLTLLNPGTGEISIEAAHGLSTCQHQRGRYQLGEGITERLMGLRVAKHAIDVNRFHP